MISKIPLIVFEMKNFTSDSFSMIDYYYEAQATMRWCRVQQNEELILNMLVNGGILTFAALR